MGVCVCWGPGGDVGCLSAIALHLQIFEAESLITVKLKDSTSLAQQWGLSLLTPAPAIEAQESTTTTPDFYMGPGD